MENSDVMKTRELGVCLSCEICSAGCPEDAIAMEYLRGQFLPQIDYGRCTNCGLCLEICPGIDVDPFGLRNTKFSDSMFDGPWLNIYTAHINDLAMRKNSASGGLVTGLIVELIKSKEFNAAFILPFNYFSGQPARLRATGEITEIIKSAGSKYIPASVYDVINVLKEPGGFKKYVVVGTPCQIRGIKKYIKNRQLSEENLLFLGLFCDKTLNFNILRYFEDTYAKSTEKLIKFQFRTKEKNGWPGNSKIYFNSGRELVVNRNVRMQLKDFFQLRRCLFCTDKLNQLADISFGDCYVAGKGDFHGKSSVIIRTAKGNEVFNKYAHLFTLEKEGIETIRESQNIADTRYKLEHARLFINKNNLYPGTTYPCETSKLAARRLSSLEKLIGWGENYRLNRIKLYLGASRAARRLKTAIKWAMLGVMLGMAVLRDLFRHGRGKGYMPDKAATGNIVIIGGAFFNKGAQALNFTVVDQMKRRFPNKDIYLLSSQDFHRTDEEKSIYKFSILPWDMQIKRGLLGAPDILLSKMRRGERPKHQENHVREVMENAHYFIDLRGYVLSSQWGFVSSINYLLDIIIAKRFSIPYYIFPQSMGPFDYSPVKKLFLYPLMKLYLPYPEEIFIREEDGLQWVRKFTKKNVAKSYDIVLTNKGYDLGNIYASKVEFKNIEIAPHSVAIIPSERVLERTTRDGFYSIYCSLIRRLLLAQKTVYILRHSYEDLGIIEELESFFPHETNVKSMKDDISAIEFESLVGQFDFIIASRYHSIVHAYKSGVPALVIGWAVKYLELLDTFGQRDYCVDIRSNPDTDEVISKLEKLIVSHEHERKIITDTLAMLQPLNIFDTVGS